MARSRVVNVAAIDVEDVGVDVLVPEPVPGGPFQPVTAMYAHILQINLFEQAPKLDVPVYFFQGRHDGQAPGELTERYYNSLVASHGKTLVWFEESAHVPMTEQPQEFVRLVSGFLKG